MDFVTGQKGEKMKTLIYLEDAIALAQSIEDRYSVRSVNVDYTPQILSHDGFCTLANPAKETAQKWGHIADGAEKVKEALKNLPSAEPSEKCVEQIKWERDTAVQQLKELGYGFGEKIRTDADTISRRDAIDAIEQAMINHDSAIMRVVDLPSAEPKHRTGKWLIRRDTNGKPYAQCSECKRYFNNVYDMENFDAFCRHCGTKMEGLKEVEE